MTPEQFGLPSWVHLKTGKAKEVNELLAEYRRKFGDTFPIRWIGGDSVEVLKECLRTGKPYKSNLPKGVLM